MIKRKFNHTFCFNHNFKTSFSLHTYSKYNCYIVVTLINKKEEEEEIHINIQMQLFI